MEDATTVREARSAMYRLIIACNEDVLVARDARSAARDTALAEHLRRQSVAREEFVEVLRARLASLGGVAPDEASGLAWARSIVRHLRALVGGWHEGDAYAAVVHAEERAARAYDEALAGWLPDDARDRVREQLARIRRDLDEARTFRALH